MKPISQGQQTNPHRRVCRIIKDCAVWFSSDTYITSVRVVEGLCLAITLP